MTVIDGTVLARRRPRWAVCAFMAALWRAGGHGFARIGAETYEAEVVDIAFVVRFGEKS